MLQNIQFAERDSNSSSSLFPRNDDMDIYKMRKSEGLRRSLIFGTTGYIATDLLCHNEKLFKSYPSFFRGKLIGVVATIGIAAFYACRINQDYQFFPEEMTHPRWLCMGGTAAASLGGACFSSAARFLFGKNLFGFDIIAGVVGSVFVGVLSSQIVHNFINSSSPKPLPIENRSRENNFELELFSAVPV